MTPLVTCIVCCQTPIVYDSLIYIYLQFSDFTTGECANLYLGTIFSNPEDIYVYGQFVAGRISLDRKFPFDFITLKWDTIVLSLIDLDLPMPTTLQISNWQKSKIRRMFGSNNSIFRIVAHNPNTLKVRQPLEHTTYSGCANTRSPKILEK